MSKRSPSPLALVAVVGSIVAAGALVAVLRAPIRRLMFTHYRNRYSAFEIRQAMNTADAELVQGEEHVLGCGASVGRRGWQLDLCVTDQFTGKVPKRCAGLPVVVQREPAQATRDIDIAGGVA